MWQKPLKDKDEIMLCLLCCIDPFQNGEVCLISIGRQLVDSQELNGAALGQGHDLEGESSWSLKVSVNYRGQSSLRSCEMTLTKPNSWRSVGPVEMSRRLHCSHPWPQTYSHPFCTSQSSLEGQNLHTYSIFIRMAHWLWSGQSNHDCLAKEDPRIQELFSL